MASALAIIFGALVSTYIFLRLLLHYTQHANEPPTIATSIPFISPILEMMAKKTHFYTHNRDKYGLPIYTLRMPGSRLYVVNSTALIPAVQRQYMILAFPPIEVKAAINAMGASERAKAILMKDLDAKEGRWECAYAVSFSKAIHPAISLGASLDSMNRAAIQKSAESLEALAAESPKAVKLFDWIRHEISLATTESVYGPKNPFKDPAVEAAFWKFGPGIVTLLINIFPSVLAKGSLEARELIVKAFERYFKEGGPEEGSALIKARYDHSVEYNISVNDIARFEIGGAVANVANTGPAAFWVVYHMFSDSAVLEDIRREVSQLVKVGPNGCTIDISKVKTSCPTLVSTFQEVLRFHSIGTSVRVVMDDHLLDGKYLLKKGNTVMIPGAVQHSSTSIWGENVAQFDHKRFVRSGGIKGPNPVAVRGFGGGTTLCPGRHFASTQVLGFAALMALRFDVAPVAGRWIRPTTEKAEMWTTVPQPDFDIEAAVTSREGGGMNGKLNVIFAGSDKAMELSAEDIGTART